MALSKADREAKKRKLLQSAQSVEEESSKTTTDILDILDTPPTIENEPIQVAEKVEKNTEETQKEESKKEIKAEIVEPNVLDSMAISTAKSKRWVEVAENDKVKTTTVALQTKQIKKAEKLVNILNANGVKLADERVNLSALCRLGLNMVFQTYCQMYPGLAEELDKEDVFKL